MTPPERLQDVTLAERLIALADEMMAVRKECSEADIWVPRSFPRFWSEKLRDMAAIEAAAALSVRGDFHQRLTSAANAICAAYRRETGREMLLSLAERLAYDALKAAAPATPPSEG